MCFRCYQCKQVTKTKEKCYKIVLSKREKTYTNEETGKVTTGWEAIEEAGLCSKCHEIYEANKPAIKLPSESVPIIRTVVPRKSTYQALRIAFQNRGEKKYNKFNKFRDNKRNNYEKK
jgi:hypothetical protein